MFHIVYGNGNEDWHSQLDIDGEAEACQMFTDIQEHPENYGVTDCHRASYAILRRDTETDNIIGETLDSWSEEEE